MLSVAELLSKEFSPAEQPLLWQALEDYYCAEESSLVTQLIDATPDTPDAQIKAQAWINTVREQENAPFSVNELMARFGLDSSEGLTLLSLAEALLRIPDDRGAEALIEDKLGAFRPGTLLDHNENNLLAQTALWSIALSQELIDTQSSPGGILQKLIQKLGNHAVLNALRYAMTHLGTQFVFAETVQAALAQRHDYAAESSAFSFDMLGEAAVCDQDVADYFNAYLEAIQTCGAHNPDQNTSISIKLSALHPRLENAKLDEIQQSLSNKLFQLLATARQLDIAITIDAEESERLELSLLLFEQLFRSELCNGWGKLGLAVQAYSKRALPTLRWLALLAEDCATDIPVRLVKGAYWDREIKHAQQQGLSDYPVFTHKSATDLSYIACSSFLLSDKCPQLQPQFATHNALTIAQITQITTAKTYEFQRLHGMGEPLYQAVLKEQQKRCRIYAPIGDQRNLLPYLVRRLLENGANSSFVFQLGKHSIPVSDITQLPSDSINKPRVELQLPKEIYLPIRNNSSGNNLGSLQHWRHWQLEIDYHQNKQWYCQPIIAGEVTEGVQLKPLAPSYQLDRTLGYVSESSTEQIKDAIGIAEYGLSSWRNTDLDSRCKILIDYAALLEMNKADLACLLMFEAGKTLQDALNEIREAIDFCYYYATSAANTLKPERMLSVTGEENWLSYQGRGIFLCISPWNFPLAIFTGQIAAALVSGNVVLAKPSSYTSLIAFKAVELWLDAGLPGSCLQLLPCSRGEHTDKMIADNRINGVVFTGSTQTAMQIQQQLANRPGSAIATLIAETGGINAMIAESSALPEQVILDCIHSAFNSAGQRCSALRVLYLQEEMADEIEHRLIGAMQTLQTGSPEQFSTDVGPVINKQAMDALYEHIERCRFTNQIIHENPLAEQHNNGYFVAPTLIRLRSIEELPGEVFGPVLHLIRYSRDEIDRVIQDINRTGYGLTFGIHSRNDQFIDHVCSKVEAGNLYINRDQVGAIVGSQPFGGMGFSGTGPKAGGPNYLKRFVREQTRSQNTTASGGNRELLSRNPKFG